MPFGGVTEDRKVVPMEWDAVAYQFAIELLIQTQFNEKHRRYVRNFIVDQYPAQEMPQRWRRLLIPND